MYILSIYVWLYLLIIQSNAVKIGEKRVSIHSWTYLFIVISRIFCIYLFEYSLFLHGMMIFEFVRVSIEISCLSFNINILFFYLLGSRTLYLLFICIQSLFQGCLSRHLLIQILHVLASSAMKCKLCITWSKYLTKTIYEVESYVGL